MAVCIDRTAAETKYDFAGPYVAKLGSNKPLYVRIVRLEFLNVCSKRLIIRLELLSLALQDRAMFAEDHQVPKTSRSKDSVEQRCCDDST